MRRARGEPVWPLVLIMGVVGVGLGIGALFLRGPGGEDDPGAGGAEAGPEVPTPEDRIRVEVLNAGGVQGAAGDARDYLRGEGFDVVFFGNADAFSDDPTVVIDRDGRPDEGRAVARSLGAPPLRSEPDPTLLVDVTVMVGVDWRVGVLPALGGAPNPVEERADPADDVDRAWWDPRRFLDRAR